MDKMQQLEHIKMNQQQNVEKTVFENVIVSILITIKQSSQLIYIH